MQLKHWLTFVAAMAAVGVLYLGVQQLGELKDAVRHKEFSESPRANGVVPLAQNRFAVVDGKSIIVYSVNEQGQVKVIDDSYYFAPRDPRELK